MYLEGQVTPKNMALLIYATVLFLLKGGEAFNLPHHASLTQTASVACSSYLTSHTLVFYLDTMNDTVQAVYTVNSTTHKESLIGTNTSPPSILGDGTTASPYVFNITAEGTPDNLTLGQDALNAYAEQLNPGELTVVVMSKASSAPFFETLLFPEDVMYVVACNFSETKDILVSSGKIQVIGDITESPNEVQTSAVLSVYQFPPTQPVSSVFLGTPILLGIEVLQPTAATGVYAHSCQLCDRAACDGQIVIEFIDLNGCSVGSYISAFSENSTLSLKTQTFLSFILFGGNSVYFRCRVNFCFLPGSSACIDYCAHNQGRRRRRDVGDVIEGEVTLSTPLLILPNGGELNPPTETFLINLGDRKYLGSQESTLSEDNTPLTALVVALSVLLIIGLVAGLVLWVKIDRLNRKSHNMVS